jgi:hypothetical protein
MVDPIDTGYRRTVHRQLTVQESRDRLARKIFHGQRGELRASRRAAAPCSPAPPHGTPTSAADRPPTRDGPSDYAIASSTTNPIRPPSNSR